MEVSYLLVIVLVAIICGTAMVASIVTSIVRGTFKYQLAKSKLQKVDASLTTSELHGLMRDAVAEATEPLNERVAALEQRLEAQPQPPPTGSDLLAGTEGYVTEVPNVPQRQPVR